MKCLSLTQPWATLVAIGAKRIETRGWSTAYRGPLAIHASKRFPKWAQELVQSGDFSAAFNHPDSKYFTTLPLGSVIATCQLTDCKVIKEPDYFKKLGYTPKWAMAAPPAPELSFGDYTVERYGWILEDVERLPEPVPARGMLSLWEWTPKAA